MWTRTLGSRVVRGSVWVVVVGALVGASSCGMPGGLGGAPGSLGSSRTPLTASCAWDPGFSLEGCSQSERWVEFAVRDATTASMQVEVSGSTKVLKLTGPVPMSSGLVKFTGAPNGRLKAGTLVRVKATQSAAAGGKVALSNWFPYLRATPVVDCPPGCTPTCAAGACGVADGCGGTCGPCAPGLSCVSNSCVCVPSCGSNRCGSDGCGGSCGACGSGEACAGGQCTSACVPPWDPQWAQQGGAGEWWAEFKVAGGGALTTAVVVENLATGALHPLTYNYGRWTGGVTNLLSGTQVVLRATNALGATAKTMPFRYLIDLVPVTNPCGGTAATNTTCQPLSLGKVTFSFDDSGWSQPTLALPLLQRYGVKGTFFVVPPWHDWVSVAQTMLADGHEFAAHGMTHQTLTGLTAQQLDDELRLSKAWIQANIGGTVDSFATPSAAFNDTVVSAVKGYFGNHRGGEEDLNFVGSDAYRLKSSFMYNTSTIAGVCARIQEAATQKGWLFLTFHDFTSDATAAQGFTMPAAVFEGILACATTTPGIEVVTARQATAAIRCGSPP